MLLCLGEICGSETNRSRLLTVYANYRQESTIACWPLLVSLVQLCLTVPLPLDAPHVAGPAAGAAEPAAGAAKLTAGETHQEARPIDVEPAAGETGQEPGRLRLSQLLVQLSHLLRLPI